jgi:hypothetical protein
VGATVKGNIGHDPCQDRAEIKATLAKQQPDRLVLAYVGNYYSPDVRPAYDAFGAYGLGQRYADCVREISRYRPATQLIVGSVIACAKPNAPLGSPVINQYLRVAVQGGRYPSGASVPPLVNARYSTALDDRMTPGHIYRSADSGGVLRSTDKVHLTDYGSRIYGGVLSDMAAGRQ